MFRFEIFYLTTRNKAFNYSRRRDWAGILLTITLANWENLLGILTHTTGISHRELLLPRETKKKCEVVRKVTENSEVNLEDDNIWRWRCAESVRKLCHQALKPHLRAIVNTAAKKSDVQISIKVLFFIYFQYTLSSEIAGSYGNFEFNFLMNNQAVLYRGYIRFLTRIQTFFYFFTSLSALALSWICFILFVSLIAIPMCVITVLLWFWFSFH